MIFCQSWLCRHRQMSLYLFAWTLTHKSIHINIYVKISTNEFVCIRLLVCHHILVCSLSGRALICHAHIPTIQFVITLSPYFSLSPPHSLSFSLSLSTCHSLYFIRRSSSTFCFTFSACSAQPTVSIDTYYIHIHTHNTPICICNFIIPIAWVQEYQIEFHSIISCTVRLLYHVVVCMWLSIPVSYI